MRPRFFILLLHCLIAGIPHAAAAEKTLFRFGIVAQAAESKIGESNFAKALPALDRKKLAFVVAGGVKSAHEPCVDELYSERRDLLDHSKNPVILSISANDWTTCKGGGGKSAAAERLNRFREVFFSEGSSFGRRKIPLIRQSITPHFRSYSENSRWLVGNVLFATLHLPQNNNNYVSEAGRNAEFEDRLIANRDWLQKVLIFAKRKKTDGIVLFSDGNPLEPSPREKLRKQNSGRDGFREVRRQILKMAAGFPGKILVVHTQPSKAKASAASSARIRWTRNVGELGVPAGMSQIAVVSSPALLVLEKPPEGKGLPAGGRP